MVRVNRTFEVATEADLILDYLKDFANAEAWDPGTVSCRQRGDGPVEVGTHWDNVSEFRGKKTELDYELTELSETHVVFVGNNKTVTSTDDIRVTSMGTGRGSRLSYTAELDFHGLAKLAGPLLQREFNKLADRTEVQMRDVLGRLG